MPNLSPIPSTAPTLSPIHSTVPVFHSQYTASLVSQKALCHYWQRELNLPTSRVVTPQDPEMLNCHFESSFLQVKCVCRHTHTHNHSRTRARARTHTHTPRTHARGHPHSSHTYTYVTIYHTHAVTHIMLHLTFIQGLSNASNC